MSDQPEQLQIILPIEPKTKNRKVRSPVSAKAQSSEEVKAMPDQTKTADFETMLADLEKVVGQLEGELKLEEALSLFERGLNLSQQCEQFLKQAQQKIEVLKKSASGSVSTEVMTEDAEMLA